MEQNLIIFPAFKTNSEGIWYFVPQDSSFCKGIACKGFGVIRYDEGSVYTGEIFYDGVDFHKQGYGQQDFSRSHIGQPDPILGEKIDKFVGYFDYRKNGWIYGNGILYYTYIDGRPSHFRKGWYYGLKKKGKFRGKSDKIKILDGYSTKDEFDYDPDAVYQKKMLDYVCKQAEQMPEMEVLFIGDSYFAFMQEKRYAGRYTFQRIFPDTYCNLGIGGTCFFDWLSYTGRLTTFPAPRKILINLGFNDLHDGNKTKKVMKDCEKFLSQLKCTFPTAKIYILKIIHCPKFSRFRDQEDKWNSILDQNASAWEVIVGDCNTSIAENYYNCFSEDKIHLNEEGYRLFSAGIAALLSGVQ